MKRLFYVLIVLLPLYSEIAFAQCDDVTKEVDKFDHEVTYRTNLLWDVSFSKVINRKGSATYISLSVDDNTVVTDGKGATILLDNGLQIRRNTTSISVDVNENPGLHNGSYAYSAFFRLLPAEMALLKTHRIVAFKLYVFDKDLNEDHQQHAFDAFQCIASTK